MRGYLPGQVGSRSLRGRQPSSLAQKWGVGVGGSSLRGRAVLSARTATRAQLTGDSVGSCVARTHWGPPGTCFRVLSFLGQGLRGQELI